MDFNVIYLLCVCLRYLDDCHLSNIRTAGWGERCRDREQCVLLLTVFFLLSWNSHDRYTNTMDVSVGTSSYIAKDCSRKKKVSVHRCIRRVIRINIVLCQWVKGEAKGTFTFLRYIDDTWEQIYIQYTTSTEISQVKIYMRKFSSTTSRERERFLCDLSTQLICDYSCCVCAMIHIKCDCAYACVRYRYPIGKHSIMLRPNMDLGEICCVSHTHTHKHTICLRKRRYSQHPIETHSPIVTLCKKKSRRGHNRTWI